MAPSAPPKISSSSGYVHGRFREESMVCQYTHMINSQGCAWFGGDPFSYNLPVILAQFILIFIITRTVYYLIRPLKQSMITAQLIAGIIMGASVLGRIKVYVDQLFPPGGRVVLETIADVGFTFHLFILGVHMDATKVKRTARDALLIGASCFVLPFTLGGLANFALPQIAVLNDTVKDSLPYVAMLTSITAFPVITSLLSDLKLLNSEIGRIATSASLICDICNYIASVLLGTVGVSAKIAQWHVIWSVSVAAAFFILILFIFRPMIVWLAKNIPDGQAMKEAHFLMIVVIVMICAFSSEVLGQPAAFGTFLLGVVLPDGPPLGTAFVQKLDTICTGLLLPAKFVISGLTVNVFAIKPESSGMVVEAIILFGYAAKFLGALIPALYYSIPLWDAISLALILCCKGIIEASIYINYKDSGLITTEEYSLLLITMLITTGFSRPLICRLYDPSRRYSGYQTNSILFSDPDSELRFLVCVHHEENVPTFVNLLDVSTGGNRRPVSVSVLNLMELKGTAAAVLVPNIPGEKLGTAEARSDHIFNAFEIFRQRNQGFMFLEHFTSIAPYPSMHDDICTIALDKNANMVIVPFHKLWAIDGSIGASFPGIRMVNQNVIQKAPCSVGVLIDRGQIAGTQSTMTTQTILHITVLFIGGADDREALAYGSCMAAHPHVKLVVMWLKDMDENKFSRKMENDFDQDLLYQMNSTSMAKQKIKIVEERARDAVETTKILRSIEDSCDLCVVGRYHDPESPLLQGLTEWSEYPELGVIGDVLATSEFRFSVLVVQQQPPGHDVLGNVHTSNMASSKVYCEPRCSVDGGFSCRA